MIVTTPTVGDLLTVRVEKIALGKDGKIYVTVSCDEAENKASLIWKKS